MNLNPASLRFSGIHKNLEESFLEDYTKTSLKHIRLSLALGFLFYAVFGVLDALLIPSEKHIIWAIRYVVVCPVIASGIYLTYIPRCQRFLQPILCGLMIISGAGIVGMIIIAPPPVSYSYYAGLILVFMFGYTLIRARFIWASIAGWIVVLLYEGAAFHYQTPLSVLINNNFFFVGANIAGMIACYSFEFYSRRAYYLNWLLVNEKDKVKVANRELESRVEERTKQLTEINDELSLEIRDRKKSEAELKVKNLVFEAAITANSITDENTILTTVNKTFLKTWGYTAKEEIVGKPIAHIFHFQHEAEDILSSLDKNGNWEGEFTALRNDGSTFDAYGLATTIHDSSENIAGYQSSVIDISDRKKMEKEKIQAQKIAGDQEKFALVGQIAGKIAHDFNNILGIILAHTEFALSDCDDQEIIDTFEVILDQGVRGKNLTRNLIAFAKGSEPKQEYFSLNEKIEFVINLLKSDLEGIEIRNDQSEDIRVLADPGMIEHSLVNLFQNSIHALSLVDNPRIITRIYCDNNSVGLEIEDNGCGIPSEYIENIFDPSFSLKGSQDTQGRYKQGIKGTGYGMANVKKYIELHKGTIGVDSSLGSGTTVIVSLPLPPDGQNVKEFVEVPGLPQQTGKRLLIVEDEPALSEVQRKLLTRESINHLVDIAPNGQAAFDLLNRNEYDLISLDYMLPGKINGMDVYHHIREINTSVPVLFLSGNIEFLESIETLKLDDPYLQHLSKPCLGVEYLKRINELLECSSNYSAESLS